ncbi:uncharacterized protein TNCV_2939791 [Trichonephila clavipes]|nr:uncharacterized protein TNCV_2939791 [Trichonephila clavipes]
MQPMLVDLSDISNMQYQAELAELQNNDSVKTLFSIKGAMAWLGEKTEIKYPNSTKCTRKLLLPFPSSFLAECGFMIPDKKKKKKKSAGCNTTWGFKTYANQIGTQYKISLQQASSARI